MYNFYIPEGKKFISYKPTKSHYTMAILRKNENSVEQTQQDIKAAEKGGPITDNLKQYVYLYIKLVSLLHDGWDINKPEVIEAGFDTIEFVSYMLRHFTPKEFMQMFPVEKDYDGRRYEVKDYFTTMETVREIGIHNRIGDRVEEFLFGYCNDDINKYMVTWMMIVNRMHQLNGGRDVLIEFMEEQGVHPRTLHEEDGYFVDDETGEKYEIKKPVQKFQKFLSIEEV